MDMHLAGLGRKVADRTGMSDTSWGGSEELCGPSVGDVCRRIV
jgi:hypothetical protein